MGEGFKQAASMGMFVILGAAVFLAIVEFILRLIGRADYIFPLRILVGSAVFIKVLSSLGTMLGVVNSWSQGKGF